MGKTLHDSFRFPQIKDCKFNNRIVYLPKIGWVGFYKSQEILGKPKNITISYHSGHWYMSVQTEVEISKKQIANDNAVGIDLGISKFATCAFSYKRKPRIYKPLNSFSKIEKETGEEQRKLERKKKFC